MRPVIILFAKAPLPGRVKTRLAARLGAERAAALHAEFVRDTLETLLSLASEADVHLSADIETDAWREFAVPCSLQTHGDLGARMYHALDSALREGRPQAMITGSDSPTLPAGHLRALLASSADVALGPSRDGGYYAIACRRVHPGMFDGVEWSQATALTQTAHAARRCGLTVEFGPEWFDVDSPEDFDRLAKAADLGRHVRRWLAEESTKHGAGDKRQP